MYVLMSYYNGMTIDEWLAHPQGLHAVHRYATRNCIHNNIDAVKSFFSTIMVQDALLLRIHPKPTDYDIDSIRNTHLQHLQYFAHRGWDVPPEAHV